jgi:hypothetical protein
MKIQRGLPPAARRLSPAADAAASAIVAPS